jgi:V/A-type H+-transporting ATPase subunit K
MDGVLMQFKDLGVVAALAISATGSALGTGVAAMSAVGAWKKCYLQNKAAPILLSAFVGAPLTQTIYGFILMNFMMNAVQQNQFLWSMGIFAGIAMGTSAFLQGKAAAGAADAMAETGKGFANYLLALGIIESVALFTMVFMLLAVGRLAG